MFGVPGVVAVVAIGSVMSFRSLVSGRVDDGDTVDAECGLGVDPAPGIDVSVDGAPGAIASAVARVVAVAL